MLAVPRASRVEGGTETSILNPPRPIPEERYPCPTGAAASSRPPRAIDVSSVELP